MKLLLGDCLEKLKELEDNSIDSIVTDPPYGLSFMGKDWDKVKATRETQSQVVKGLGAGMKMTTLADNIEFEKWVTEWSMECYRVLKPGGYMLAFGGSRMYHRLASGVENAGFEIRDQMMWIYGSGFPKSLNIGKGVDKKLGNTREVIGEKHRGDVQKAKQNGSGYLADPANRNNTKQFGYGTEIITKGNTEWEGWGTALKPAHEPIVMARKPLIGTVANNVLEYGVGGINIDGCRVGNEVIQINKLDYEGKDWYKEGSNWTGKTEQSVGRFPANIIFDEEAGKILDEQSGERKGFASQNCNNQKLYGGNAMNVSSTTRDGFKVGYNDNGGASRFFYCPKSSKRDRNEGCDELHEKTVNIAAATRPPKGEEYANERVISSKNFHPTVKPTELMKYLIRLVTPKGGIVLDPFMGSGSTGKAAVLEGMEFIGIEREPEYFEIAEQRIGHVNKPKKYTEFFE